MKTKPRITMKKTGHKSQNKPRAIGRRSFVKLLPAAGVAGLTVSGLPLKVLAQTPTPTPTSSPRPSPTPLRITKDMMHNAEKLIGIELTDKQEDMALLGVNRSLDSYEVVRKLDVPLDTEPAIVFHPALPGFHVKRAATKTKFKFGKNEPAQDADNDLKRGKYRGPLHGIPWGAKDLFATKGIKTTWGAEPYRDQMIDYDATVVERLRQAGAVLVAKLSMGALAQGPK